MNVKPYKDPRALAARIYELNAERRALQKQVDVLKAEEDALLAQVVPLLRTKKLPQYELPNRVAIRRVTNPIATITDWPHLLGSVEDTYAKCAEKFDEDVLSVIYKRVSPTTIEKLARKGIHFQGVSLQLQEQGKLYVPRNLEEE